MNKNRPFPVSGELWYDTKSLELKVFDGANWITIRNMKPIQNDLKIKYIWKRKFAFIPYRCDLSGNIIWLKYGMQGGPTWNLVKSKQITNIWHDEHEHLNWAITNA
jgi:hypothetical protein